MESTRAAAISDRKGRSEWERDRFKKPLFGVKTLSRGAGLIGAGEIFSGFSFSRLSCIWWFLDTMTRKLGILILGLALVAALTVFSIRKMRAPGTVSPAPPSSQNAPAASARFGDVLQQALARLQATDVTGQRETLGQFRQALAAATPAEAAAAIRRFLDLKLDARTGQSFKVGAHGFLDSAPTLRTFLLDYLGQIDPAAAAAYAREILAGSQSPDEWALALRNLARGDQSSEARALLEQKAGELLRNTAWQQQASVGYLEAFDAAVFLGGTNLLPALTDLVRKQDNQAAAHAAYLALDRLVINNPAQTLQALADPSLMQGREATRANYFARVDVRDPDQRRLIEKYLLDSQISSAEHNQFAGLFPNANFMVSQNLLTPTPTPDHASLTGRDAASLNAVQQWLADPRFASLRPQLEKMQTRLEQFVRQAQGGR
jgi:hypothetical protein